MKHSPIHSNVSLKNFNTFGIEAKALYYAEAKSTEDLHIILNSTQAKSSPHFILGGGSNVLFTQDLDFLVIRILMSGIKIIKEDTEHVWIQIGAGENWHHLVLHCVENNWGGIENLSLIPGTVGAAPVQNIGAYGVELKDVFSELQAFRIVDQSLHTFKNIDCHFGYRDSIFKNSHKNQYIICSITLRLDKKPNFHLSYKAVAETLKKHSENEVTLRAISNAIIDIRRSKLPDPHEIGNAGSFFKNPEIMLEQFKQLQQQYPDIPHYATSSDKIKIPAGWLIEQCGWKGKRSGNIGVYPKQALVLVNYGNATGQEIKQLADQIKNSVAEKFNIDLLTEVNIV